MLGISCIIRCAETPRGWDSLTASVDYYQTRVVTNVPASCPGRSTSGLENHGMTMEELSPAHWRAIGALVLGATSKKAAESACITDRALRNWKQDPTFQAALAGRRAELFEQVGHLACNAVTHALQQLMGLMDEP